MAFVTPSEPPPARFSTPAPPHAHIPWLGFRFVFGLVNAALWFCIGTAMTFWVTHDLDVGTLQKWRVHVVGTTVAFVALFGLPGYLPAAFEQAMSGRYRLPDRQNARGILRHVWWWTAGLAACFVLVWWGLCRQSLGVALALECVHNAGELAIFSGKVAAAFSFVSAVSVTGDLVLGDLPPSTAPTPPAPPVLVRDVLMRVGVPQALSNAALMGLIAALQATDTLRPPTDLALEVAMGVVVVGFFSWLGGASVMGADRAVLRVGRVAFVAVPFRHQVLLLLATAAVAGVATAAVAAVAGGASPSLGVVENAFWAGFAALVMGTASAAAALAKFKDDPRG